MGPGKPVCNEIRASEYLTRQGPEGGSRKVQGDKPQRADRQEKHMNKNKANEMSRRKNIGNQETFMKKESDMNNHAEWLRRERICEQVWIDLVQSQTLELPDGVPERLDLFYSNDGWQSWQHTIRLLLGIGDTKEECFGVIIDALLMMGAATMRDIELIDRAMKAYQQRCVRNGLIFNQPHKGLSEVDGNHIVLRNRNGLLARYRNTDKGLRFVKSIIKEVQIGIHENDFGSLDLNAGDEDQIDIVFPNIATKDDMEEVASDLEDLQGNVKRLMDLGKPIPPTPICGKQVDVYQAIQRLIANINEANNIFDAVGRTLGEE